VNKDLKSKNLLLHTLRSLSCLRFSIGCCKSYSGWYAMYNRCV